LQPYSPPQTGVTPGTHGINVSQIHPMPPPVSAAAPHLSARGLGCERGSRRLFERVAFDLGPSELLWVRGQNGRGKTSLLRLVAGIAAPQHGQLMFDGIATIAARPRPIVYIGHTTALKDELTVAEALEFLLRIHGRDHDASTIGNALAYWNLRAQRGAPVRTLSQGQRKRVALARLAVERSASLWILDEPFDALDVQGVQRLNELLAQHLKRDGSVLITGHQAALDASLPRRELDLDRCAS
jgi:heme exporter protein A